MNKIKSFLQAVWRGSFKFHFQLKVWQLAFDAGWYTGNPIKLLSISFGVPETFFGNKVDYISFFELQIAYFVIDFYWEKPGNE